MTAKKNTARETTDAEAIYDFVCEGCGAEGEMKVPLKLHKTFGCPDGCGATYIQWKTPTGRFALECVVCPMF